jgi:four helix bundle protein
MNQRFDLEERLIEFGSEIIDISEGLPKSFAGNHLASQLIRSGTSPALNYGEAQGAESRPDFIHKMKVCLKELRETYNCLRLINKKLWVEQVKIENVLIENNELISIFVRSISTAQSKLTNKSTARTS